MRSYFGMQMYSRLILVYTRVTWKPKSCRAGKGRRDKGRGGKKGCADKANMRRQRFEEKHSKMMEAITGHLEREFWPGGTVPDSLHEQIRGTPAFGINIRVDGENEFQ